MKPRLNGPCHVLVGEDVADVAACCFEPGKHTHWPMQPITLKPAGSFNPVAIPRHVVQQRFRTPKKNIPQTTPERNRILQFIRHYVAEYNPVPPLPVDQLKEHADRIVDLLKCDVVYRDYIGVLLSNEMWRETLA